MKTALAFICGALVLGGCASSQAGTAPTVAAPATQTEVQPKSSGGDDMGHEMAAMCPMDGDISLCVDRKPSFFVLSELEGDPWRG